MVVRSNLTCTYGPCDAVVTSKTGQFGDDNPVCPSHIEEVYSVANDPERHAFCPGCDQPLPVGMDFQGDDLACEASGETYSRGECEDHVGKSWLEMGYHHEHELVDADGDSS